MKEKQENEENTFENGLKYIITSEEMKKKKRKQKIEKKKKT